MNTNPTPAELQSEIYALKQRVALLESKCAGGGGITCSALTVVDVNNQPVAAIDATGLFQCRRLRVESPGAGTWLEYAPPFAELVIYGLNPQGGAPIKLVTLNEGGLGRVSLLAPAVSKTQSFARITPDPDGGRMELGDKTGKTVCDVNVSSAGSVWSLKSKDPQQGYVNLGVDGSGSGQIVVADATGTVTAKIP